MNRGDVAFALGLAHLSGLVLVTVVLFPVVAVGAALGVPVISLLERLVPGDVRAEEGSWKI